MRSVEYAIDLLSYPKSFGGNWPPRTKAQKVRPVSSFSYPPVRRRVFVSYHHHNDQPYYDSFSKFFHDGYETITDNSLERAVDSSNFEYIMRRIRETHLHGSSCTIVLCGAETPNRRYVDWEIHASLDQQMGIVGIGLPTIKWEGTGTWKPARLQDNIDAGYASWTLWQNLADNPQVLHQKIEETLAKSKWNIANTRPRMQRNA
ncbi:TIR domain-containing protein [Rhizobium leguminosarum]|uniref:TIR domain-containing protein n=1 Tax=Rhizobium leguminosarum TaxID=384 RepID=UPI003ED16710